MVARFWASRFFRAMCTMPGKWLIRCQGARRASRSWMTEASILFGFGVGLDVNARLSFYWIELCGLES